MSETILRSLKKTFERWAEENEEAAKGMPPLSIQRAEADARATAYRICAEAVIIPIETQEPLSD